MHNYKELKVWQKTRILIKEIYVISSGFPETERFGIISQIRRAAISISNNIAEGSGRGSNTDFKRFLDYSFSSAYEVESMLFLTFDLEYLNIKQFEDLHLKTQEIQKMIFGLKKILN